MRNVLRWFALAVLLTQFINASHAEEKTHLSRKNEITQEAAEELFQLVDPALLKESSTDDELRKLLKARYSNAASAVEFQYRMFSGGRGELRSVFEAGKESIAAALELCQTPQEKIAVLEKLVKVTKYFEEATSKRAEGGLANQGEVYSARASRLGAEIQLLRAKKEVAIKAQK